MLVDLSARAKLRVSGRDALRFLNGQVTNDVRKASAAVALEACVLNTKGRIDAHVFIHQADDAFILDAEPGTTDALSARLDRYIIADDVTVTDVTDEWRVWHVIGDDAEIYATRFGVAGRDVWLRTDEADATSDVLQQQHVVATPDALEQLRIENGVPVWDRELTPEINPMEANLETRAIDFAKGCYIGQEVISRMKMSGQTNKRLCGLRSADATPLVAAEHLFAPDGKDVGWVTSAIFSERFRAEIGLGFVKRGYNTPGTELRIGSTSGAAVAVVALPFA